MDIVQRLNERTALRYMGDCKCGKCHLVPVEYIAEAVDEIERLREALDNIADKTICRYAKLRALTTLTTWVEPAALKGDE